MITTNVHLHILKPSQSPSPKRLGNQYFESTPHLTKTTVVTVHIIFFLFRYWCIFRPPLRFKFNKTTQWSFLGPLLQIVQLALSEDLTELSKSFVEPCFHHHLVGIHTRSKISHPTEGDIHQLKFDGETAHSAGPKK